MFLDKIDVRTIVTGHLSTLRDYGTQRRSVFDIVLFFGVPAVVAGIGLWNTVQIHVAAVNGILTAFAIFVGLLFNLLMMVLMFLQTTQGNPADKFLQVRKQLLREITANLSFSILISVALVGVAIFSLIGIAKDGDVIGPIQTCLLVAGSVNFVLNLLMVLRRMYALILNEFDRHKLNRAA